jgi:ribosomal protein S18 acetylase RimI-like enzyme
LGGTKYGNYLNLNSNKMLEIRKLIILDADNVEAFAKWVLESVPAAFFSALGRPLIEKSLNDKTGFSYGMFDGDTMIAISLVYVPGSGPSNYGYDLGYSEDEMNQVAQLVGTIVSPEGRQGGIGHKLFAKNFEAIFEANYSIILVTTHPDNIGSWKLLTKNGFEAKKNVLKYGGLPRIIWEKRK